jgi:flagellar protein FliO/FliZ
MIGRMLLALGAVLGVMWLLARFARRPLTGNADRVMSVLARQQLNRNSSVAVLRVLDRAFVLGVTDQGVSLLTETELAPIEQALTIEQPNVHRLNTERIRIGLSALQQARKNSRTGLEEHVANDNADAEDVFENVVPSESVSEPTPSGLDGSILSKKTWSQLISVAREATVRR